MMLHTKNIKALGLVVPDKKMCSVSLYMPIIHVTPAWGYIWPQGQNLNKLGISLLNDATYQISRL